MGLVVVVVVSLTVVVSSCFPVVRFVRNNSFRTFRDLIITVRIVVVPTYHVAQIIGLLITLLLLLLPHQNAVSVAFPHPRVVPLLLLDDLRELAFAHGRSSPLVVVWFTRPTPSVF